MHGLGTIINVIAILLAGLIGSLIRGGLPERFQKIVSTAIGLVVMFMGVAEALAKMITIEDGKLNAGGTLVVLFSLVLGAVAGELINLDGLTFKFGEWLKRKTGNEKDHKFVDAFVDTSLTVCIGAMAIMGSLMDGLTGDYSILLTKGIIDFITVLVLTTSMGRGCAFSAIPVALLQGVITALASVLSPILTDAVMDNIIMVGSILIFCVGLNILLADKFRIKVANLLPSVIFAGVATLIPFLG